MYVVNLFDCKGNFIKRLYGKSDYDSCNDFYTDYVYDMLLEDCHYLRKYVVAIQELEV